MAIENSAYIAGLNTAIPANTDPRAEGAAQMRGTKTAVKNTFPNVAGAVNATHTRMNEVFDNPTQVPVGLIGMWSGDITSLPEGWNLCDGTTVNGFITPDLRGKFIMGHTDTDTVGTTGGENFPEVGDHISVDGHALTTAEMPAHSHDYTDRYYAESKNKLTNEGAGNVMDNDSANSVGSNATDNDNTGMLYVDSTTEEKGSDNEHTHGLSVNESNPFDNRPEYYVLAYIVYVGVDLNA